MTILFLKFLGGCLLVCCGGGLGWTSACRIRATERQISAFIRFLQYLKESIQFRNLPGPVLLTMAARHPEFRSFCPEPPATFSGIRPPGCLRAALETELREGLELLEHAPAQNACDTLEYLTGLCRRECTRAQDSAYKAMRLYPRMGACLGLMAAVVLS